MSVANLPPVSANVFYLHGHRVTLPAWMPVRGWRIEAGTRRSDGTGYLRWNSTKPFKLNKRAHRLVVEHLLGRELRRDEVVHHQDFDKLNNLPSNLIIMPECLNPSTANRDPYTGQFLTRTEYIRRYGIQERVKPVDYGDGPDTVV
jgi:hypothetical protein